MRPIFFFVLFWPIVNFAGDLPDPRITPGAVDHNISQANIQQTVCQKGYTKTVRPPAYFTNKLKKTQLREYGYPIRIHGTTKRITSFP